MLELVDISKSFGETHALKSTTLSLERGKITALLGPSGCGKSTLLRVMVGLIEPTTGNVTFDGEQLTPATVTQIRRRMGYVIQDGGLFPHMTVQDNVTLMARHLGWGHSRVQERLTELAALTHLPQASLTRFPTQISGGQRQRVSLMRALFLEPDLILLDEPMGALDPLIRSDLQKELRAIFSDLNTTVVMVTHDISEAGFLADTIALLKAGEIIQLGSLADLVERPADPFVTEFINAQRSPLESLHGGAE